MAAVPTFTGDGGPILSLMGEQHTEFVLFCGTTLVAAFLALPTVICQPQTLEDVRTKHGDLVSILSRVINTPY